MPITTINGKEYELSDKLRVAYKIQGQNNHVSYMELFSKIDTLPLEKQVEMIYVAFSVANPEEAKTLTSQAFLDYYLDNFTLKEMMNQLQDIISGITGVDLSKSSEATGSQGSAEGN